MSDHGYEIIQRDGGWAYKIAGRFSTVYSKREDAVAAAESEAASDKSTPEEKLQEGLEETFPASDPVAATSITRAGKPDNWFTGAARMRFSGGAVGFFVCRLDPRRYGTKKSA